MGRLTHYETDTIGNTVGIELYLDQQQKKLQQQKQQEGQEGQEKEIEYLQQQLIPLLKENSGDMSNYHQIEEDDEDNCRFMNYTGDPNDIGEAKYPILV